MDTLNTKIKNVLAEKSLKIKPENIKKGITVLGITGTYEGDTPTSTYNTTIDLSNYQANTPYLYNYITEINNLDITGMTDFNSFFLDLKNLKKISFAQATTNITSFYGAFQNCNALEELPLLDTSNVTTFYQAFMSCSSLKTIPSFNTSKVTNMYNCFASCSNLKDLPILDTHLVESIRYCFSGCRSLTDEDLNNIMYMLMNSNVTNTTFKTLAQCGLTTSQITRCHSLSNYQAFLDAGWTD